MRLNKKFAAIALTATVALTVTAAFALWSASGTGSGAATATTSQAITGSSASGAANLDLYPGGPGVDVSGTLNNPNHFAVSFTGWSGATVASVTGSTCATTDFQIVTGKVSGTQAISVPAQTNNQTVTLPGVVQMKSTAPDACKSAVVNVSFTLDGGSSV